MAAPWIRVSYEMGAGLNYSWFVALADGSYALIDPGLAAPFLSEIETRGLRVSAILLTHKHKDHIAGLAEVQAATGAKAWGPSEITDQGVRHLQGGQQLTIGGSQLKVLDVAGHTKGHLAFYWPELKLVAVGDALFALGCGRLFEGSAETAWAGLLRLRALPDDTAVLCGHEYSLDNASFALSLDRESASLTRRAQRIKALRARGEATVPYLLAEDKVSNPFLLYDKPRLAAAMGMAADCRDAELFAAIRRAKDNFRT